MLNECADELDKKNGVGNEEGGGGEEGGIYIFRNFIFKMCSQKLYF